MHCFSIVLVLLAGVLRLIPHPFGVSPINAVGLFGGSTLNLKVTLPVYLLVVLAGDAVFGFYDWRVMVFVYAGLTLAPFIGRYAIGARRSAKRIAGAVTLNALVLYAIANLGNWWVFYPHTGEGFVANYIAGLPYLWTVFLGDGLYAALFFGGYEAWRRLRYSVLQTAPAS